MDSSTCSCSSHNPDTNVGYTPIHILTFRHISHSLNIPSQLKDLCQQFVSPDIGIPGFKSGESHKRFHAEGPDLTHSSQYFNRLVLGSLNTCSVYRREESITSMMKRKRIGIMLLQEPMLRANIDPAFVFAVLLKADRIHVGRRGTMMIVHPSWEHMISIPDFDSADCSNIQWIAVRFASSVLYIANVYLPIRYHHDDGYRSC